MLTRSIVTSLRASVSRPARPAVSVSLRACSRAYSDASDKTDQTDAANKADDKANSANGGNGNGNGSSGNGAASESASSENAAESENAKKIAELEAKIKDMTKEMTYMRADYQTLARRATEEKLKATDFAITSFARAVLDTTDVLDTALASVPQPVEPGSPLAAFYDGVQLTKRALTQTLEHHGIKPMADPKGQVFDPALHDAVFQIPAAAAPKRADGSDPAPGEVVEVPQSGWMIKDRVLRPAQVGVVQIE